ncbi:MAG: hypothetical protein KA051_00630 [Paludibacteraceae bacterium]|jgi:hypothetical protein|nr:hypothetical protein [Paludibacteraceae bacterium]
MNLLRTMRLTHRYVGYFVAGLMLVYALTGLLLLFRSSSLLQSGNTVEKELPAGMDGDKLGETLHLRQFKVDGETSATIHFNGGKGAYEKATGKTYYEEKGYVFPLNKMVSLHKTNTHSPLIVLGVIMALSLMVLVITSFFMFDPKSVSFRKGMVCVAIGVVVTLVALCL